jgi:hypothetical protein
MSASVSAIPVFCSNEERTVDPLAHKGFVIKFLFDPYVDQIRRQRAVSAGPDL